MKKIALLLLVFILAAGALTAGGQKQDAGGQAAAPGKVEIRASYWGDTKRFDLYDAIIKEFEAANPNVTVIREPVSWNDYWDKLSVQVAGGNAPDFLSMHPQYSSDYIPRGVCEVLDPYVANGTLSVDGWAQSAIDTGKFDGKMYMAPMGITFSCVFVNSSLFSQLGVAAPGFEWSWDEVKTIGIQLRQALDAQGKRNAWLIGDQITSFNNFRYFARQSNREAYDAKGNITVTQKDVENWFAMWKDFRDNGVVPDAATSTEYFNVTLENGLFAQDRAAMVYVPVNQYWLYNTTFPNKDIGIIRHPGSKGSAHVGEFPEGAHFGVYARTSPEKKTAAAQLLNFWLNDEKSLVLYKLDQGIPPNTPVMEKAVIPLLDEYSTAAVNFVNTLSKISRPMIYPPAGASEIDLLFRTKGEQVQFDAKTPAEAAKEFYEEATAIRARAQR